MATDIPQQLLEQTLLSSPLLAPILRSWHRLELPDGWLVAGAVAQTVWNARHGLPPEFGIDDIDIVYHDPEDLSDRAETLHCQRVKHLWPTLPVRLDVKNEARVHLWYEAKFGEVIAPYASAPAAIATFPTTATAIGIQPTRHGPQICAPFGLDDLFALIVRPNKVQITRAVYQAKVDRWRRLWPKLRVCEWDTC